MARYIVSVSTPKAPDEAFAYMADLRNFAEWDPGVKGVEQVAGDGAGPDAAFDVSVSTPGRTITLRYDIVTYEPPTTVLAVAKNSLLTSRDTITVRPDEGGTGSIVTYDAALDFNGVLRLADPLLVLAFRRIGDRAATGLISALQGERVG